MTFFSRHVNFWRALPCHGAPELRQRSICARYLVVTQLVFGADPYCGKVPKMQTFAWAAFLWAVSGVRERRQA